MRTRDIGAGIVTAVVMLASTLSYSAAIFSGPLAGFLQVGIGFGLLGASVTAIIFALGSGIPFAIGGPDSKGAAVLAALAVGVAAAVRLPGGNLPASQTAALALLALLVATVVNGVVLYLCGRLRVGRWVRFVPYPVVGGFMAASGWLLMGSAVRILTREEPAWGMLSGLARANRWQQLAAALAFTGALVLARRSRNVLAFPVLLLAATTVTHAVRCLMGVSVAQAQAAGWLLEAPRGAVLPILWLAQHWQAPPGGLLLRQAGTYVALVVVTAFTLLLGITSVEVEARLGDEIDVDRELRVNGLANVASGLVGGMAGTLSLSRTLLNYQSGSRSRVSGIIVGAACLATLAFGTGALAYVPVPLLGGMLFLLGADLLDDWLFQGWKKMERVDYGQVIVILVAVMLWGFIAGVALGVIASCVTFAVNTGRTSLVKQELDRTTFSSRVERSLTETRELIRYGGAIQIIWLHGFVFFGSADNLLEHVKATVPARRPAGRCMVILDFQEVLGIDSSAVMVLVRLRQFAERENFFLVFSGLPPEVENMLHLGGVLSKATETCPVFAELDAALEWCEDRLLDEIMNPEEAKHSADEWLTREIGGQEIFRKFASYLETDSYPAGNTLFTQGETSEFLCLVYSGRVSVVFRTPEGQELRLRSIERHTLVGEMGLYRSLPRGASVVVDQPVVLYRLSRQALERMEMEAPEVAVAFHRFVIRTLSERLDFANREVAALQG